MFSRNCISGKKKAHKHKSFWPVTPPVTGGSPDREPGVKVLCIILGPKEHKSGCNLDWWGHENGPKSQKIPSFIVKNGQQKPPRFCGGFCCVFGFSFFNFFVFFSLFLLVSCCFMTSWNPKTAHQMRLQA